MPHPAFAKFSSNCTYFAYLDSPAPSNEVPRLATEADCDVCGVPLVRDRTPNQYGGHDTGPWRIREGAVIPTDRETWPAKNEAAIRRRKDQEDARLAQRVAEITPIFYCPKCGELACRDFNRIKNWSTPAQCYACDNCSAGLIRHRDPRGPVFGYMSWEWLGEP